MKKIVLFCAGGFSTSLLVNKMKESAAKLGKAYQIEAHGYGQTEKYAPEADCILLGPQIRFNLKELKAKYPEKPIDAIDMKMYGTMDGAGTLARAMELMGDK